MKKNDVLSIIITFVIGFFSGAYLYVAYFATVFTPDEVSTAENVESRSIISESYGGCRTSCPSFQLSYDGTYRFRYFPEVGGEAEIREGILPLDLQRAVRQNVTPSAILSQTTAVEATECRSFTDGIDVRYDIILGGEQFKLDSCGTSIERDSLAWQSLAAVWSYLQTGE
jgi:hypothetical protein